MRRSQQHLRSDNGLEFIAKEGRHWLAKATVTTAYIHKAGPWENTCVESFNGKLQAELLNQELSLSLAKARYVLDE